MDCFLENLVLVLSRTRGLSLLGLPLPVPEMSWEEVAFWTGCVAGIPVKSLWVLVSHRTPAPVSLLKSVCSTFLLMIYLSISQGTCDKPPKTYTHSLSAMIPAIPRSHTDVPVYV